MEIAFFKGFVTSAALIIAIGAQNAFVLRQGIKREHVLPIVLVCGFSDALLIGLGIAGLGTLVQQSPVLLALARYGGAAFLIWYGLMAARRAFTAESLQLDAAPPMTLKAALAACLAFTYLNPHCWLDTVVLLGSISSQQPDGLRWVFGAGALLASFVWFFSLGFGARLLAPLFAKPIAWKLLDGAIALIMWAIAVSLLLN